MCQPCSARAEPPQPSTSAKAMPLISQAYVEKYKFTSVVAQDLLDSFLSFFPELKEQSVDCRAGEAVNHCCTVWALGQDAARAESRLDLQSKGSEQGEGAGAS